MADWALGAGFIGAAIVSLIVISNPISTSALFIALTNEMTLEEKLRIAKRSVKMSTVILAFFALTGLLLFELFGFGLGAFRIAGGVLLFGTAMGMLHPKPSVKDAEDSSNDIALVPLAIPFTSGPGTITTVVVLNLEAQNIMNSDGFSTGFLCMLGVYIGIAVTIIVSYMMMKYSEKIDDHVQEGGRKVVTKLMGLLVMAIAVQFMINGVMDVVPEFIEIAKDSGAVICLFLN